MSPKTTRLQRFTSVILLYLLVAAAIWGVALPIRTHIAEAEEQLAVERSIANRLRGGQVSLALYEEALAEFETALAEDPRYLPATSEALAAAALQGISETIMSEAGATIRSVQAVTEQPQDDKSAGELSPKPVSIRLTVSATYPQLLTALAQFEGHTPYILIDNVTIRSASRGDPAAEWLPLSVQLQATSFLPPREKSAS